MDARRERIGRNEVLFRQVNERLKELGTSFSIVAEAAEFVCECGNVSCAEPIRMTLGEYEQLRSHGAWFAVRSGHETPDVESVVERHGDWNVVEKHRDGPAQLAEAEDPRD
jgi:hypothetical protein